MEKFRFDISLSILNHLGRNLYRNFITVLGEAISNAWDADADNVWIEIDKDSNTLLVKDDGIGMSSSDIQNKLAVDIFDDKVGKNSFSYRNKNAAGKRFENRYIFNYNRYIDDYMYGRRINPQLEVKVITPLLHEIWGDETQLTLRSTKNTLLINLPADNEFMENLRTYLKVDKYVSTTLSNHTIKNFPAVKAEKSAENQTLNDSLSMQLDNLLRGSTFFFNNNQLNVVGSDFKSRLNDALQQMLFELSE